MSQSRSVTLWLSGARAELAARDLFTSGWFEAELERRSDTPHGPASLIVARVLAIAAGSVTIADKLLAWWERWARVETSPPLEVTLEGAGGSKVSLATVSRDGLVDLLRGLHAPSR